MTTLISLISDQTIPNVQFIKEKNDVDNYIFITSEDMEGKGVTEWLITACNLNDKQTSRIIVNPFSFDDIHYKIGAVLNDDDRYLVNLTGGTKIMSLAINDLLRDFNTEMFYLIGNKNYIKIFPGRNKPVFSLANPLTIEEYLAAYGFQLTKSSQPTIPFEITETICNYFIHSFDKETDISPLTFLFSKRDKNVNSIYEQEGLKEFLNRIGFIPSQENKLNKLETKYLTGDWFEEFIYLLILKENDMTISDIATGCNIIKNGVKNEFDILYIQNDNLNIIECKTFIWSNPEETKTIISETIYKADSLKNKLGLFANTSIVTLSDLSSSRLQDHLDRAKESNVKVLGKECFKTKEYLLKELIEC
jgi:hypothetical protein